jgi:hypothetical protein
MRLFQTSSYGDRYLHYFNSKDAISHDVGFANRRKALLADRYEATHILKPVYYDDASTFFTICDDVTLQLAWAREHHFPSINLTEILLAQIEEHKADVLYQLDPIRYPSSFLRRLPGCVKKTIGWHATVPGPFDFSAYDLIVSNFNSLNSDLSRTGVKTAFFSPSWDPAMAPYSINFKRPIDVFFVGSYVRNGHQPRIALLNSIVDTVDSDKLDLRIIRKKWGRLTTEGFGRWIPVPISLPKKLKNVSGAPVYGLSMYSALSRSKIVLNPASDIAGNIRGNMRCWEALGCGACMLGSEGEYPEGFESGVNFESFTDSADLQQKIKSLLNDEPRRAAIAAAGAVMLPRIWSKERQWSDFVALVGKL